MSTLSSPPLQSSQKTQGQTQPEGNKEQCKKEKKLSLVGGGEENNFRERWHLESDPESGIGFQWAEVRGRVFYSE